MFNICQIDLEAIFSCRRTPNLGFKRLLMPLLLTTHLLPRLV